jgi:N-methylhydantoinase A
MSSSGGSITPAEAGRLAIRTALSGPAGGVAGAFALARWAGFDRIITFDMGGTSTDAALCPGRILERDESQVGGAPIRGPTVDVLSVGAGGGSLARIDAGGALRVGPESAAADPGPACYGRGQEPAVTDAHVALGRIRPEHFLGGRMEIHPSLSLKALARIAGPFGGDPRRAAAAVLRVANANMERALRVVSVERGFDPRGFTLVAFGGAGPLHACDLAEALRIPRVLVPPHPGVLSALGMAAAPIIKDLTASVLQLIAPAEAADGFSLPNESPESGRQRLERIRQELESRGREELAAEGFSLDGLTVQTTLDMRYAGQSYELPVPVQSLDPARFVPLFHATHHQRYGHSDDSRPVEAVNLHVKLVLPAPAAAAPPSPASTPRTDQPSAVTRHEVWFDGEAEETPFYGRSALLPGQTVSGPAVVNQMDTTTIIARGWRAEVDSFGNLVIGRKRA